MLQADSEKKQNEKIEINFLKNKSITIQLFIFLK